MAVYPSIEDVFNLVRVHVDDAMVGATGTSGEGRIFTDNWTPLLTLLNSSLAKFQRALANQGITTLRRSVVILNITPVNGPQGLGTPDPAVWQTLGFNGFFDGLNLSATPALPSDLLVPLGLEARLNGTTDQFNKVWPADGGLPSQLQSTNLGLWEWLGDAIMWNGSVIAQDIRLRYHAMIAPLPLSLAPAQFSSTRLPFADAAEALSYDMAYKICAPRLPPGGAAELLQLYKEEVAEVINQFVRQHQRTSSGRPGFGEEEEGLAVWS